MTTNPSSETKFAADSAVQTLPERLAATIEDPMASAMAASAATAAAFCCVLGGIALVSLIIG